MDDDNFDFNFEDLTPEENEALEKEMRERQQRIKKHPLKLKGDEIFETVSALMETFNEDEKDMYGGTLMESAMIICAKIAGALGSENWHICMQNAAIIREHAEHLRIANHGLKEFTETDKNYIKVLRTTMEEFQQVFKEWVATFKNLEDDGYEDEWGLFIREK